MWQWAWDHIALPAIGAAFDWIPWWVWIVLAGLLIGWTWKTFGWQGVVGAALAILTLGAYRQGWRDNQARLRGRETVAHVEDVESGGLLDRVFRAPRPRAIPKKHRKQFPPRDIVEPHKSLTGD